MRMAQDLQDLQAIQALLDLQVIIISLNEAPIALQSVREFFPQVEVLAAVDLRKMPPLEALRLNLLSDSAYDSLIRGRRWHKEIDSVAAVGLQLSNLKALRMSTTRRLLLLEEDCLLLRDPRTEIASLIKTNADVGMFGAPTVAERTGPRNKKSEPPKKEIGLSENWHDITGTHVIHYGTHCVFYSPRGRQLVADAFEKPLEIHIDAKLCLMAAKNAINLYVYTANDVAVQSHEHVSTLGHSLLQNDANVVNNGVVVLACVSAGVIVLLSLCICKLLRLVKTRIIK